MVYRPTTFIQMVCVNDSWFRSFRAVKSRYQAGTGALLIELNRIYSADWFQTFAAAWMSMRRRCAARSGHVGQTRTNTSPSVRP